MHMTLRHVESEIAQGDYCIPLCYTSPEWVWSLTYLKKSGSTQRWFKLEHLEVWMRPALPCLPCSWLRFQNKRRSARVAQNLFLTLYFLDTKEKRKLNILFLRRYISVTRVQRNTHRMKEMRIFVENMKRIKKSKNNNSFRVGVKWNAIQIRTQ